MHLLPIVQGLILVFAANGAPVLAHWMFRERGAFALDFGARFSDGGPLFGSAKTIRGVIASLIAASLTALLLGLSWQVGALAGAAAMAGDLLSSFIKRRLGLPPHSMAPGLDQGPECVFPLVACMGALGLTVSDVLLATLVFWIGELLISRALFSLKIREHPY